tara:strand:- start:2249 stop:3004 length:756 start_codon:yes stop_codon:yes gene_type:complete
MNILYCSLIRNKADFLDDWHSRIVSIKAIKPDWNFNISLYENDSEDGSKEKLENLDWSFAQTFKLSSEKNDKEYFIGLERKRIERLSAYRNLCIYQFGDLDSVDRVVMNDVDCSFDPAHAVEILEKSLDWDVFSFASRDTGTGDEFYDRWATRRRATDTWWDDKPYDTTGDNHVWTTGNGFVCYNPEGFKRGATFGYVNKRTKEHDSENVVVCENFRAFGLHKIGFDGRYNTMHERDKYWHEKHGSTTNNI